MERERIRRIAEGSNINDDVIVMMKRFGTLKWDMKVLLLNSLCRGIIGFDPELVLCFLLKLKDEGVGAPTFLARSFRYHVEKLKELLCRSFKENDDVKMLLDGISGEEILKQCESDDSSYDEGKYLISIITEALITRTTNEIKTLIDAYFNPKSNEFDNSKGITKSFLKDIRNSWALLGHRDRVYAVGLLSKDDVPEIMDILSTDLEYSKEIIFSIFLFNRNLYDTLASEVIEKELSSVYDLLPRMDLDKIKAGFDTYKRLLICRPKLRDKIIGILMSDKVAGGKQCMWNLLSENFQMLSGYLDGIKMELEELLKIVDKSSAAFSYLIKSLPKYAESSKMIVCEFLRNRSSKSAIELLERIISSNDPVHIDFINFYIRSGQVDGVVKDYLLSNLVDNSNYFYSLMVYFKREKNLEALGTYLVDEKSLEEFLRVFRLSEIFYFGHYVHNIECAKSITRLCIEHRDFSESTFWYAFSKIENPGDFPPIFMRSMILSMAKLPALKKQIIPFVQTLVKSKLLERRVIFNGVVRVLESMDGDAIKVILCTPQSYVIRMLRASKKLSDHVKEFVYSKKGSGVQDNKTRRLRNIVQSFR